MINVPSLYKQDPRTRKIRNEMISVPPAVITQWEAMELLPGAEVRVTTRNHTVVRLEAASKPSPEQKKAGIFEPWYVEIPENSPKGYWLWQAAKSTDMSPLMDGEWSGTAIGEQINRNPLGVEGHKIVFSSLFPWRDTVDVEVPPALPRTPIDFADLRYWLATTPSMYPTAEGHGVPLAGIVWWLNDEPVAMVRSKDFPEIKRAPNPDAKLPDDVMDISEVIPWSDLIEDLKQSGEI